MGAYLRSPVSCPSLHSNHQEVKAFSARWLMCKDSMKSVVADKLYAIKYV